jgi:TonB family protein
MKAVIKIPCQEDWDSMKIGMKSRFCESCTKNVIDFTQMSRDEILSYLLENRNEQTCGRIYNSQLDFSTNDYLVTIQSLSKKAKSSNLSFYLLAFSALLLSGCSEAHENNLPVNNKITKAINITQNIENNSTDSISKDTIKTENQSKTDPIIDSIKLPVISDTMELMSLGMMVMGDVAIEEDLIEEPDFAEIVYMHPQVMPEFPGGIDSLMRFMYQHVIYPEWEKEKGIEGTIYVQFTVDTTGKTIHPRILKTIPGSKNMDQIVLDVIEKMPNWKPAIHSGSIVKSFFTLPVRFKSND